MNLYNRRKIRKVLSTFGSAHNYPRRCGIEELNIEGLLIASDRALTDAKSQRVKILALSCITSDSHTHPHISTHQWLCRKSVPPFRPVTVGNGALLSQAAAIHIMSTHNQSPPRPTLFKTNTIKHRISSVVTRISFKVMLGFVYGSGLKGRWPFVLRQGEQFDIYTLCVLQTLQKLKFFWSSYKVLIQERVDVIDLQQFRGLTL